METLILPQDKKQMATTIPADSLCSVTVLSYWPSSIINNWTIQNCIHIYVTVHIHLISNTTYLGKVIQKNQLDATIIY